MSVNNSFGSLCPEWYFWFSKSILNTKDVKSDRDGQLISPTEICFQRLTSALISAGVPLWPDIRRIDDFGAVTAYFTNLLANILDNKNKGFWQLCEDFRYSFERFINWARWCVQIFILQLHLLNWYSCWYGWLNSIHHAYGLPIRIGFQVPGFPGSIGSRKPSFLCQNFHTSNSYITTVNIVIN